MPTFEWRPTVAVRGNYALYTPGRTLRHATIRYHNRVWRFRLTGWGQFIDTEYTDADKPPTEFVESMVLLSVDIRSDND